MDYCNDDRIFVNLLLLEGQLDFFVSLGENAEELTVEYAIVVVFGDEFVIHEGDVLVDDFIIEPVSEGKGFDIFVGDSA